MFSRAARVLSDQGCARSLAAGPAAFLVSLVLSLFASAQVSAQDISVPVTVTILEVQALEDFEGGGDADWYAFVTIDGHEMGNEDTPETDSVENDDHVFVNWKFTRDVDLARGAVDVIIEIRDEDGFLRLGDDLADVDPDPGASFVNFSVALSPCAVSGEVNGSCGQTFTSAGVPAHDDADGAASVSFKVEVMEPAAQAGVLVRCTHRPIWPQPGETVELKVEALDGALDPRVSDSVELWFEGTVALTANGRTRLTTNVLPGGDSFVYGCKVNETTLFPDDVPQLFSGWRRVSVGAPPSGRAVPVLYNVRRGDAVDILLVPDQDNYSGGSDPAFIEDAGLSAFDPTYGYYSERILLERQDLFNLWLAQDTGDAEAYDDVNVMCPHVAPSNYLTDYLFADSAIILHTDDFRDCADPGQDLASTEPPDVVARRTIVHETGHRPFGLADEYCHKRPGADPTSSCDGGYWEPAVLPNVFVSEPDCVTSALANGRAASACQEWISDRPSNPGPFYTHDPPAADLMVDNEQAERLDRLRINWFFDQCLASGC